MYIATTVTASQEKVALLKKLGADLVIDCRTQDFIQLIKDYDAVLDTMSFLNETKTLQIKVLKKTCHYLNVISSDWALNKDGKEHSFGIGTAWNFIVHKMANFVGPRRFLPRYDFCMVYPNGTQVQQALDLVGN